MGKRGTHCSFYQVQSEETNAFYFLCLVKNVGEHSTCERDEWEFVSESEASRKKN